jgi:transposase-like protein
MQCPECGSSHIRKHGKKRGKQNHICVNCGCQFIKHYDPVQSYSDEFKRECLKMYVNGTGFRTIERVKGVHHTTVIDGVEQVGQGLPDADEPETIPEVEELDKLETFVGSKKPKSGCGQRLTTSKLEFLVE